MQIGQNAAKVAALDVTAANTAAAPVLQRLRAEMQLSQVGQLRRASCAQRVASTRRARKRKARSRAEMSAREEQAQKQAALPGAQ
jgi:hypothetical protein